MSSSQGDVGVQRLCLGQCMFMKGCIDKAMSRPWAVDQDSKGCMWFLIPLIAFDGLR